MLHRESQLQQACFNYFRYAHPRLASVFFAVPNGGQRNKREGSILKAEGVKAGVADALLLSASGEYHGLCIEFKTDIGRQSPAQKEWQRDVERQGYKYEIIRNIDTFIDVIENYLYLQTLK